MHSTWIRRTFRKILRCILVIKFNNLSLSQLAEHFVKKGFIVHLIDLRGFGYKIELLNLIFLIIAIQEDLERMQQ